MGGGFLQRTLILYESKYEVSEKIVGYLSLIMGSSKVCRVDEFTDSYKHFDLFIIGSSVYEEIENNKIMKFIIENNYWLKEKNIALFCDCCDKGLGEMYLHSLEDLLGEKTVCSKVIAGEILPKGLKSIKDTDCFLSKVNSKNIEFSKFNIEEVINFALNLNEVRNKLKRKVPEETVKALLESFLTTNNTCTLCTGKEGKVRGTTIEYFYSQGYIYMLTEGGEKFANILLNPNVSICIYSSLKGMNRANGVQISGIASLVYMNCKEYNEILRKRGLKSEQLMVFPAYLNLLKVKLNKAEYLSYKFVEMGYEGKQNYIFADNS